MSNLYLYDGPVTQFGRVLTTNYKAYAYAKSDKQAENFFKSRWKKEHGYLQNAKVELPGEIEEVIPKGETND